MGPSENGGGNPKNPMGQGKSSPTGKPNNTGDQGEGTEPAKDSPPPGKKPGNGSGLNNSQAENDPQGSTPKENSTGDNDSAPGSGVGTNTGEGTGEADTAPDAPGKADAANEQYAREATELAIRRLKDQLQRDQVDQKLLDELGWDADRLKKFVDQMERALRDPGEDQSPAAVQRRRQFQTTLENLKLPQAEGTRKGTSTRTTRAQETGGRFLEPPPEYRDQFEAYTKSLKAQPAKPAPKK